MIMGQVQNKNPGDIKGITPLHNAASNGHFDTCQLIIGQVENKNPVDIDGFTPLYNAAICGHFEENLTRREWLQT